MRRPDPTTPSLLGLPLAWLGVFFLLPVALVARRQPGRLLARPGGAPDHARGLARLLPHARLPPAVLEVDFNCSLIVSAIVVAPGRYPVAYFLAMSGTKRKYILLLILIAPFLTPATSCECWPGRWILGNNGVLNSFLYWTHLRAHDHPISRSSSTASSP